MPIIEGAVSGSFFHCTIPKTKIVHEGNFTEVAIAS